MIQDLTLFYRLRYTEHKVRRQPIVIVGLVLWFYYYSATFDLRSLSCSHAFYETYYSCRG